MSPSFAHVSDGTPRSARLARALERLLLECQALLPGADADPAGAAALRLYRGRVAALLAELVALVPPAHAERGRSQAA